MTLDFVDENEGVSGAVQHQAKQKLQSRLLAAAELVNTVLVVLTTLIYDYRL